MNVLRSVRWFSSRAAAPTLNALESSQPGHVVPLKPSDLRSLLPEGFGGSAQFKIDPVKRIGKSKRDDQWWHCTYRPETFGLLVRPETTTILNNLKDLVSGKASKLSCVLDGEKGTGKWLLTAFADFFLLDGVDEASVSLPALLRCSCSCLLPSLCWPLTAFADFFLLLTSVHGAESA